MPKLTKLFKEGEVKKYKKQDLIMHPKSARNKVFLIKEGFIVVFQLDHNNKRKILHIIGKGDIFPLAAEILSNNVANYLEAHTAVTLVAINKTKFFKNVYRSTVYLKELAKLLSSYLLLYVGRLENLEQENMEKKVIKRIMHFRQRFGRKKDGVIILEIPITHEFIAESISVARENVSRELSKLQKEKIISFRKGYLYILKEEELKKRSQS